MLCGLWSHLRWGAFLARPTWQTASQPPIRSSKEADDFTSVKGPTGGLGKRGAFKPRICRLLRDPTPSAACRGGALWGGVRPYFSASFALRSSSAGDPRAHDGDREEGIPAPPQPQTIAVQLHNLPKNWLHEEIIEFIHQVAEHAGIAAPGADKNDRGGPEDPPPDLAEEPDEDSAIPHVSSPFIRRLRVPFGRRTGLVYGRPTLVLTSAALGRYLVEDLQLDPEDYRSQIHFEFVDPELKKEAGRLDGGARRRRPTTYHEIEETIEDEQAEALRTLELDRYLMAPDLLLDITKSYQRRRLTMNEKIFVDSFLDDDEDADDDDDEDDNTIEGIDKDPMEDGDGADKAGAMVPKAKKPRKGSIARKKRTVRANKKLGQGSMQNIPIPKPYVQGRNL